MIEIISPENEALVPDYTSQVSPILAQIKTAGGMTLEFFPPGFIALQKELCSGLHPTLEKKLGKHPVEETDMKIAEIALHCSVVVNGTYTLEERDKLCRILAGRLEVLREIPVGQVIQ